MKSPLPLWLIPLLCLALPPGLRAVDFVPVLTDTVTNVGNVMAYVLPAVAFGTTAWFKDGEGAIQVTESMAITAVVTVGLKYSVRARRPNGDPYSFPSGHAAFAFASAEFLRKRYGWQYGAPAYVFASFVGYSRVRAHEHYTRDVLAGAAIGAASSYFMTTPYHGWSVQPEFSPGSTRLLLSRSF